LREGQRTRRQLRSEAVVEHILEPIECDPPPTGRAPNACASRRGLGQRPSFRRPLSEHVIVLDLGGAHRPLDSQRVARKT
jgi:hypothetical protein